MTFFIFIGLLVGLVMGLTGAGGALVSIPLFMSLLNTTMKEATALSLLVVLIGAGLNLITESNRPDYKTSLLLMITSGFGSYLSLPLKANVSDSVVALILSVIALYSVWSVWSKKLPNNNSTEHHFLWGRAVVAGALLGLLTTMTGLGGGVLLVPVFIKFFDKNYSDALSTSLLSIFLVSGTSLFFQRESVYEIISLLNGGLLFIGALVGAMALRRFSKRLDLGRLDLIRKIAFSLVATYSIGSFAFNTFN